MRSRPAANAAGRFLKVPPLLLAPGAAPIKIPVSCKCCLHWDRTAVCKQSLNDKPAWLVASIDIGDLIQMSQEQP